MYAEERQDAIAAMVISKGRASVAELAQAYDVTTETVRRDLAVLDKAGRRCAGCTAAPFPCARAAPRRARRRRTGVHPRRPQGRHRRRRDRVLPAQRGQRAAGRRHHHRAHRRPDADRPRPRRGHQLGTRRRPAGRLARRCRCNCSAAGSAASPRRPSASRHCGCSTPCGSTSPSSAPTRISARHGLSTPDSEEAAVKRAMVRCANYVVVAADSTKVGREDFVSFAPISSVDTLITDTEISDADRTVLTDAGRRGHLAEDPHDRHRHAQPQHRPHRHARHAADPRRGAPDHLGHHRAGRQGRQRGPRARAGRTRRRRRPARGRRRPHGRRAAGQRRGVPLRARHAAPSAPTSRSPNPTAPQPNSTSRARRSTPPRSTP